MKQLDIYLDLGHLDSLLALAPTKALLAKHNGEARVLPVKSQVPKVASEVREVADDPLAAYKTKRRWARRKFELEEVERNCAHVRITLAQGLREVDARTLHLGLLYCDESGGDGLAYCEQALDGVFRPGEAPEPGQLLESCLTHCGFEVSAFETWQSANPNAWDDYDAGLIEQGIFLAPGYVLEGERYQGRQHLPLLDWVLGGKNGVPPV